MLNELTDFDIVNFPFVDGDFPRSTSYGAYISQLIRFVRVFSHFELLRHISHNLLPMCYFILV